MLYNSSSKPRRNTEDKETAAPEQVGAEVEVAIIGQLYNTMDLPTTATMITSTGRVARKHSHHVEVKVVLLVLAVIVDHVLLGV